MTCKECLHLEACCDFVPFDGTTEELSHYLDECTEQPCEHFKNKADFVEVVRCKGCKYGINHQNQKSTLCTLKEPYEEKWENAFCSNGERRE